MSSGNLVLRRLVLLAALTLFGCPAGARPPPDEGAEARCQAGVTTSLNAHVPPFARWRYEPFWREAAVQIALREWHAFGQQVVLDVSREERASCRCRNALLLPL